MQEPLVVTSSVILKSQKDIVESSNVRFIENGQSSGSEK